MTLQRHKALLEPGKGQQQAEQFTSTNNGSLYNNVNQ